MANLNRWQGIGRLGNDIEVRYMPNGDAVTSFNIACDDSYKDKQSGQKVEQVEWVRCVAFRQAAEFLGAKLLKGNRLYASGKLKTRTYEKDGVTHRVTEVHLDQGAEIIDWPPKDAAATPASARQPAPRQQSNQRAQPAPQSQQGTNGPNYEDFDDDIPFAKLSFLAGM